MSADRSQQEIIEFHGSEALVLAGPGCGKTHMLSRRITTAQVMHGVDFSDMVCLTFTNRAAREMNRRIAAETGAVPEGLFVGNIHRFCLRFLLDNRLMSVGTSVIDEDDRDRWLEDALGVRRPGDRKQILDTAALLYGQSHGFHERLLRRPDFTVTADHISAAEAYACYKRENRFVDFDDLLLMTYSALTLPGRHEYARCGYRWLQVDEVQDLTPLQLAITVLIMAPTGVTAVYFGDEQQAIFEFAGAGGPALDMLRDRCRDHTYRLSRNYRSSSRLVDLCNDYARRRLGRDPGNSPAAGNVPEGEMQLLATTAFSHDYAVAARIREWGRAYHDESVAVLVHTNDEADRLSALLDAQGIEHVTVSRSDLFRQPSYKTIYAHMAVVTNQVRTAEWVRLLYQTEACASAAEARSAVARLREVAATPADLLDVSGRTALMRFCDAFSAGETVVIDTETTGLDVFEDDIIEIAAVKFRDGRRCGDAVFNVTLQTVRPIPPMLSDGSVNPAATAYATAEKLPQAEALKRFAEFVGDAVICGHNADFDCEILRSSFQRHAPGLLPSGLRRKAADTLQMSRLLFPELRDYSLAAMIERTETDGVNSHRAHDDAAATAALAVKLADIAKNYVDEQERLLSSPVIVRAGERLREVYGPVYSHSMRLRRYAPYGSGNTLWHETGFVHDELVRRDVIAPIGRIRDVAGFVRDIVGDDGRRFRDQLSKHLQELRTFRESDILASDGSGAPVTVMTVHKAKGLEFDNVIVYDAAERETGHDGARTRVFYVAFSRARKRLAVFCSGRLSESVASVAGHFACVSDTETEAMALLERLHGRRERR